MAERVHIVKVVAEGQSDNGDQSCEVRQWESMSGWGAYVLKYVMGVPKQLDEANLKYIQELKEFAERL